MPRRDDAPARELLTELARSVAPVTLAAERRLPVLPAFEPLLPDRGLRRGSVVVAAGSTALALALAAGPSAAGSYLAVVNHPDLGIVAAAEVGVDLGRCYFVPAPGQAWAQVVAALLEALDVVVVRPPRQLPPVTARGLTARVRERGAVLLATGHWPEADLRLAVRRQEWRGLDRGAGHLQARRVELVVEGRRGARRQASWLWLPDQYGQVALEPSRIGGENG